VKLASGFFETGLHAFPGTFRAFADFHPGGLARVARFVQVHDGLVTLLLQIFDLHFILRFRAGLRFLDLDFPVTQFGVSSRRSAASFSARILRDS
jgi:hypothetical protein